MDEEMFDGDRFNRLKRLRTLLAHGRLDPTLHWREPVPAGT